MLLNKLKFDLSNLFILKILTRQYGFGESLIHKKFPLIKEITEDRERKNSIIKKKLCRFFFPNISDEAFTINIKILLSNEILHFNETALKSNKDFYNSLL